MSKPIPAEGIPRLPPEKRVARFAALYRRSVNPAQRAWLQARSAGLGLHFSEDELTVLAALDTPARVQEFLDTQLSYNNDHATVDQEETAMPPRRVLQTGMAHCFEGAMFAYAVHYLHNRGPLLVLLEASQDADHNLVVCRDVRTGLYGSNAQSRYPGLRGRPASYETVKALAESYYPFYYSDRTLDPKDLTLIGYSDGFDLTAKFGVDWMASEEPLWDIYYTYVDDTRLFHNFFDDPGTPHYYPSIRALKENWVRLDAQGRPYVSPDDLPSRARELWGAFWKEWSPEAGPKPRGKAHDIEMEFMRLTGTTPIDLDDNAFDFQFYLAAGYRLERLLTARQA
ncbi:MAG: hypothetical protein FJY79_09355 [Candidatus Aminicenantes bacterium]|nr:hypothetical protein [Candidatus Aminicenantes bacterium]